MGNHKLQDDEEALLSYLLIHVEKNATKWLSELSPKNRLKMFSHYCTICGERKEICKC